MFEPGTVLEERNRLRALIAHRDALDAEGQRLAMHAADYRQAIAANLQEKQAHQWLVLAQSMVVAAVVAAEMPEAEIDCACRVQNELFALVSGSSTIIPIPDKTRGCAGWLRQRWFERGFAFHVQQTDEYRRPAQVWLNRLAFNANAVP